MNYPEHIYKQYEIVEKDILGKKHFGLVRVYNFFGIKIRRHLAICRASYAGYFGGFNPRKWWDTKYTIESCIRDERWKAEYEYHERLSK